jgi:hypothetical protein
MRRGFKVAFLGSPRPFSMVTYVFPLFSKVNLPDFDFFPASVAGFL